MSYYDKSNEVERNKIEDIKVKNDENIHYKEEARKIDKFNFPEIDRQLKYNEHPQIG